MPHSGWILVGGSGAGAHGPERRRIVYCIGIVTVALARPPCDSTSGACGDGAIPPGTVAFTDGQSAIAAAGAQAIAGDHGNYAGGLAAPLSGLNATDHGSDCERIGWQAKVPAPQERGTDTFVCQPSDPACSFFDREIWC
jgi:hypothetical protein